MLASAGGASIRDSAQKYNVLVTTLYRRVSGLVIMGSFNRGQAGQLFILAAQKKGWVNSELSTSDVHMPTYEDILGIIADAWNKGFTSVNIMSAFRNKWYPSSYLLIQDELTTDPSKAT